MIKEKNKNSIERPPVIVVMGHIDHGKSTLLDFIRKTNIVESEAGSITQHISAYEVIHEKKTGDKKKITFIDTPGHEAFTTLRKRGGSIADIAVLVIDINEGLKPQTLEAIDILKTYKTPFVIAANKIDVASGFLSKKDQPLVKTLNEQQEHIQKILDERLYDLVAKLSEIGLNSDRFDRVDDFTKQIAIVPCSAKTGDGIPEVLMMISGLAQRFLEEKLVEQKDGKGSILEIKEEKGIGKTLDVIVYAGSIKKGDQIVIAGLEKPIVTKVKGLFEPEGKKLKTVNEVKAACGVKISALNVEEALVGMPIWVANDNLDEVKEEIQKEIEEVLIETEKDGIVIKADTIGSLEALTKLLKEQGIPIKKADIGDVTKKDVAAAESEKDDWNKVVVAFNVKVGKEDIKIIHNDIIYKIIEDLVKYREEQEKLKEAKELENLVMPCKLEILKDCIFRINNPAIVGVEILAGKVRRGIPVTKSGKKLSEVKEIQSENKSVTEVESGKQVAISLPGLTVGRQIKEGDILYSDIPEEDFRKLKKLKKYLKGAEVEVLKELAEIKRKKNVVWGV